MIPKSQMPLPVPNPHPGRVWNVILILIGITVAGIVFRDAVPVVAETVQILAECLGMK